jgi:hypothetical protein
MVKEGRSGATHRFGPHILLPHLLFDKALICAPIRLSDFQIITTRPKRAIGRKLKTKLDLDALASDWRVCGQHDRCADDAATIERPPARGAAQPARRQTQGAPAVRAAAFGTMPTRRTLQHKSGLPPGESCSSRSVPSQFESQWRASFAAGCVQVQHGNCVRSSGMN